MLSCPYVALGSPKHSQILYDVKGFRPRLPCSPAPIKLYIVFLAVCILGCILNLLVFSLSSPKCVVLLLLAILFSPMSHCDVGALGWLYMMMSLLLALKFTLSCFALLTTVFSITWVSIGVEGSMDMSSATVGAPTFDVPMFVPRLCSSICRRRGLLYRL